MILGDEKHKCEIYAKFVIIYIRFAYNAIIRRLVLNSHGIIINMGCLCIKLTASSGIAIVKQSQKLTRECYRNSTKDMSKSTILSDLLEKSENHIKAKPIDIVNIVELKKGKK